MMIIKIKIIKMNKYFLLPQIAKLLKFLVIFLVSMNKEKGINPNL